MKQPEDTSGEQWVANDTGATLSPAGSLAEGMTALQKAADEIGPVDSNFDQKSFFDAS